MQRDHSIRPLHRGAVMPPLDYPERIRSVRMIEPEMIARSVGDPDAIYARKVRPAPPEIIRKAELADAKLNRRRWVPTDLSDYALGIATGFLIGLTPFLVMLVVMVRS